MVIFMLEEGFKNQVQGGDEIKVCILSKYTEDALICPKVYTQIKYANEEYRPIEETDFNNNSDIERFVKYYEDVVSHIQVTDETKNMALNNICFLLNQYIKCSAYENIVFCWVMHEQDIINHILNNIDTHNCNIKNISLICDKETLKIRLMKDVEDGIRKEDVIERSINRISLYNNLNTLKINTNNKAIDSIVDEIISLNINTRVKK